MRDATYNPLSDVWSFGVVIFEILCREEPHIREDQMTVGIRIRDDGLTPTIPNHCDPFMRDLMRACWKLDPTLRPVRTQNLSFRVSRFITLVLDLEI